MNQLTNIQIQKIKPLIQGYKVRRAIKTAKKQFQNIIKQVKGNSVEIYFSRMLTFTCKTSLNQQKLNRIQYLRKRRRQIKKRLQQINQKLTLSS